MKRKPIQISMSEGHSHSNYFVLCNDGTLWKEGYEVPWKKMPDIPQPEDEEHKTAK